MAHKTIHTYSPIVRCIKTLYYLSVDITAVSKLQLARGTREMATKMDRGKLQKTIKVFKSIAIIIAIITIILLPFQIPQYGAYYVTCGFKKPVKVMEIASQTYVYIPPTNTDYNNVILFVTGYYCTEQAAQAAGLESIDKPYERPSS